MIMIAACNRAYPRLEAKWDQCEDRRRKAEQAQARARAKRRMLEL